VRASLSRFCFVCRARSHEDLLMDEKGRITRYRRVVLTTATRTCCRMRKGAPFEDAPWWILKE